MRKQKKSFSFTWGCVLLGIMTLMILVSLFYTPYDPNMMSGREKFLPPSFEHVFGTDHFGRDIFSRVMEGARVTFLIGAATVAIGSVIGTAVGLVTAYYGGIVDEIFMRINDTVAAFPSILLALIFISVLGSGKYNIILALGIVFIPGYVRIVRGEVIYYKHRDFVKSAKLMGVSDMRILFVHILPNTLPVLLSALAIGFNNAVLAEASMSYLGIGVQPPDASLGRMLSEAQAYLFTAPWYALFPGLTIILLVLGCGLFSDGIQARRRR